MKKFFLCLFIFSSIYLCGCDYIKEIEDNTVITACIASVEDGKTNYGFYVSVPEGAEGGEDTGSKSSAKLYEFYAGNFKEAISLFQNSGIERADVSHLTLFAATADYYLQKFVHDEKYIRSCIPSSSLVYTCVVNKDTSQLISCLDNEYKSKADDFTNNTFKSTTTPYKCTLSELSLACNNPYYTASIPVIETRSYGDNNMPTYAGTALYSQESGLSFLTKNEHASYVKWRKKYPCEMQGYKLDIYDDKLSIKLNDNTIKDICVKYSLMDTDVLNAKYYSVRLFKTYEEYKDFFDNYNMMNCVISGD